MLEYNVEQDPLASALQVLTTPYLDARRCHV